MITTRTATVDDIWPPGSGGCLHPPAVRDEIIRVAREEVTEAECRAAPFAHWYRPFYVAEQKVLERRQRRQEQERTASQELAHLRAENQVLADRVTRLERHLHILVGPPGGKGGAVIAAVGAALGRSRREVELRIEQLERAAPIPLPSAADLAGVGQRGPVVRYEGVWDRTKGYGVGALVTKDGAAWVATNAMAAGIEPGKGQTAWILAVKSPQAACARWSRTRWPSIGSKPVMR